MNTTELHSLATRRLLAGLFFVIMAAIPFITHAAPAGEGWNGEIADKIENAAGNSGDTADKPILIKEAAELAYLAQQANEGGYILKTEIRSTTRTNPPNKVSPVIISLSPPTST